LVIVIRQCEERTLLWTVGGLRLLVK